mgnify:FL=1
MTMNRITRNNFHPVGVLAGVQSGDLSIDTSPEELRRIIVEACHVIQRQKDDLAKLRIKIERLQEYAKSMEDV